MQEKVHAVYSASSSDRWVNCPGSIKLSKHAPPQLESKAASEGTLAHYLAETCLTENLKPEEVEGDFPDEMISYVSDFIDYVQSQLTKGCELLVEEKVKLDFIHPSQAFGTVDVSIVEPFGTLHVIDFKYGQGYVNHVDNSQMIYYALGIAHKHFYDFDSIKTTIFQPRSGSTETVRTDTFSVNKLRSWSKTFKDAVKACEKADPQRDLNAGEWCKFCPAKVICPAISRQLFDQAKLDFSAPVQPDPSDLTIDQLKEILNRSSYLKLWIKEIEDHAYSKLERGEKVPGWTLVPTKAQRVWKDPAKTMKGKFKKYLSKTDDIVTPAQAEKILKNVLTKKQLKTFLDENIISVSNSMKLEKVQSDFSDYGFNDLDID